MFSIEFPIRLLDMDAPFRDFVRTRGDEYSAPIRDDVVDWLDSNLTDGWEFLPHRSECQLWIMATVYFNSEEDLMLVRLKYGLV